jgi:hypothetical protein
MIHIGENAKAALAAKEAFFVGVVDQVKENMHKNHFG